MVTAAVCLAVRLASAERAVPGGDERPSAELTFDDPRLIWADELGPLRGERDRAWSADRGGLG